MLCIPDPPDRIFLISCSGSIKTNVLYNLIKYQQPDIDKIYLYVKDPLESKYQLLINRREKVGTTIDDVYENLECYNPTKKRRTLIVFDDMIADIESNKKSSPTVTEFFFKRKTEYFTRFYLTILFQSS